MRRDLGLVLQGLWFRRWVSLAVLLVAALVVGAAVTGPLFLRAAGESVLRDTLDDLEADHAQGERAIRELQHSLLAWEQMGEARRDKFEQQLKVYTARYLRHMKREETEVLPRALSVFGPADWDQLDEAFGSHQDPLAPRPGQAVDEAYAPLRERILAALPAPWGWGPALA